MSQNISPLLQVYLAWLEAWIFASSAQLQPKFEPLTIDQMTKFLQECQSKGSFESKSLSQVVLSFRQRYENGEITIGGKAASSCRETNILSESYDPRVECDCDGISDVSAVCEVDTRTQTSCRAIAKMLEFQDIICDRPLEWNGHGWFTAEKLKRATKEIICCSLELREDPKCCSGAAMSSLAPLTAPDRRPNPLCDTPADDFYELFPSLEKIKLCADSKYFFAIACGQAQVDQGILRAISDTGNAVLIGDYCEAATPATLSLLQKAGAAATSFTKLCHLAGFIQDWHMDVIVAAHLQFMAIACYRNHATSLLPPGIYGSRMTGTTVHRHIDLGYTIGMVTASLATGWRISEAEYMKASHGIALINDLIDIRSDTVRKQRENTVIRGIRGCLCEYINQQLLACMRSVRELIEDNNRALARVAMSFCTWSVMASHHKLYELVHGTRINDQITMCRYHHLDGEFTLLLQALERYGSSKGVRPSWDLKRRDLDKAYHVSRESADTHLAWIADCTRLLMKPDTFRQIVDVVHYAWSGDVGDVEYCP